MKTELFENFKSLKRLQYNFFKVIFVDTFYKDSFLLCLSFNWRHVRPNLCRALIFINEKYWFLQVKVMRGQGQGLS